MCLQILLFFMFTYSLALLTKLVNSLQVGEAEYLVERGHSDSLGTDASARSPWTGVTQFLPTSQKIIQFSSGLTPKVSEPNHIDTLNMISFSLIAFVLVYICTFSVFLA